MQDIVRTPIGNYMQTCLYIGARPKPIAYTTLNELFGVNANAAINNNDVPAMRYVHIGVGGHENYVNESNISVSRLLTHRPTDTGLFKPLPFAVRPIDNDLTDAERRNYCCIEERTINNRRHRLYWVRRIDNSTTEVEMSRINKVNGVDQPPVEYVPQESSMRPTPVISSGTGTNEVSGDKIVVSAALSLTFSSLQVQELLNAATIMYGDESAAVISEVALCTGIDRVMNIQTANGGTVQQNEAVHLQINCFTRTKLEMQFASRNAGIDIDVGSAEPVGI